MTGTDARTDDRIPVTVLTGFLGAGKTTLLNRILKGQAGANLAVIVNEFGEIGIDGDLVETGDEELIELSSGCICCVVRGDLIRTMRTLLAERPGLDGIVIETTGLANPSPVIQTLVLDQVIGAQCRLDSVLCVVDAVHVLVKLDQGRDAADQIAFADNIVLNKAADATLPLDGIEARLRSLNPFAPIRRADRCDVPLEAVLGRRGFDLDRIEDQLDPPEDDHDHHGHGHGHTHIDESGIESLSLSCEAPLDAARVEKWLQEDVLARFGADILRTKGILAIAGENRKLVVQAVNMMLEGDFLGEWEGGDRTSRLVFIGRHLDRPRLAAGFEGCRVDAPAAA
jgi:G3E family GTPase